MEYREAIHRIQDHMQAHRRLDDRFPHPLLEEAVDTAVAVLQARIDEGETSRQQPEEVTWYEYIHNMSVKELAEFLTEYISCTGCIRWGNNCFPNKDPLKIQEWLETVRCK